MYITDWYPREGWMIFHWWFMATLMGAAVLPLCARFLPALPDRGWSFARILGMVIVGITLWLMVTLRLLQNTTTGIVIAWGIVLVAGTIMFWRGGARFDWRAWWREHRAAIIAGEVIFIVVFYGWSLYRASNFNLLDAEKPMDSMLMNTIMQTTTFPPEDAWLSRSPISYYYFGHLIAAMLSMLAYTPGTAGYNLMSALLFALPAQIAFGILYNMVKARGAPVRVAIAMGIFGTISVNVMSNYQFPLVEAPYQFGEASAEYLQFWDVRERLEPIAGDPWIGGWSHKWYFRSSRTVSDRVAPDTYFDRHTEVITEFPFFSYLHADNHSHVNAIPITLLVIGLGLNLILLRRPPTVSETVLYGIVLGALGFTITWNLPPGLFVIVGAEIIRRLVDCRAVRFKDAFEVGAFALGLALISTVSISSFYATFSPYVGGVVPNLYQYMRPQQLVLVMGAALPLSLVIVGTLIVRMIRQRQSDPRVGVLLAGVFAAALIGVNALLLTAELSEPQGGRWSITSSVAWEYPNWSDIEPLVSQYRSEGVLSHGLLFGLLALTTALILPYWRRYREQTGQALSPFHIAFPIHYPPQLGFALLLMAFGFALLLVPEYVFVRDLYGTRTDTLFKLSMLSWLFLGIGVSYGVYALLFDRDTRIGTPLVRALVGVLCLAAILPALAYAPTSTFARALHEPGRFLRPEDRPPLTLDGGHTLMTRDDYAAALCLLRHVGQHDVVVASGVFDSNERFPIVNETGGVGSGRLATVTGLPSPLGWGFNQVLWRKADERMLRGRVADMRRLFTSTSLDDVRPILNGYQIDYVFYGEVERLEGWYGDIGEQKFIDAGFPVVCDFGSARVYEVLR